MKRAIAIGVLLAIAGAALRSAAQERAPVIVNAGEHKTYRIAVQRFADDPAKPDARMIDDFRAKVIRALEFSNVFTKIEDGAFLGPVTTPPGREDAQLECPNWSQIGADGLLEGEVTRRADGIGISFRVWDPTQCKRLIRRRYQQSGENLDSTARRLADDVVEAFIGVRGVSGTEIAFVSDRGGNKEIYVMNADGSDARAATANRSLNNFPNWSPDGDAIIYTSYRYLRRPFLFLSSRGQGKPGRLLARLGDVRAQYRGVFATDHERMALVMSDGEASQIYTVGLDGRDLRRLTNDRAIDVSPSFSPDGKRIAFVSDRTGAPQVYIMDLDGGNVRRLTYDGSYNTNPSWSPDGLWIAYETRVNGQFDIWMIDPEGVTNVPLETNPRSDEGPSWAPNSRAIVFSSTRRGLADLYVVDRDGSNLRRITAAAGNNTSPAWGPYTR
ncbi:MAG TPA: Tol-Pal system beta propeller repeat protein TolB [Myxococcota bacterium]|nr:Tol-Pal system beta propeller repeat protein TolB [Myxococcota bacterium]